MHTAELHDDVDLRWDDGDVWKRDKTFNSKPKQPANSPESKLESQANPKRHASTLSKPRSRASYTSGSKPYVKSDYVKKKEGVKHANSEGDAAGKNTAKVDA